MTEFHDFDKTKLYFRKPYKISCKHGEIEVLQPSIGKIVEFGKYGEYGEKDFYQTLYTFILNPTSLRLQLWDMGIDWNKLSDYELFCMRMKGINLEATKLLFKDINFESFNLYNKKKKDGSELYTLYSEEHDIELDEESYNHIAQYLRTMFGIFPKVETTKGKTMKEWLIEEERDKLKTNNDDEPKSILLPLISTYVNHPGTKYKSSELCDVGIFEFMDSIQRLQIYESTISLMRGMYSGMIDTKDIDKEALNFMRDN